MIISTQVPKPKFAFNAKVGLEILYYKYCRIIVCRESLNEQNHDLGIHLKKADIDGARKEGSYVENIACTQPRPHVYQAL